MAERSEISWTDATFNPWIGCTKVSPGCDDCYAARQDGFRKWTPAGWGAGQPRKRTSAQLWRQPVKWNAEQFAECRNCGWRGEGREAAVRDYPGESVHICPACDEAQVHKARRRVFCASLADVFDNEVPPEWRADLFRLILDTPSLDWLLLTKRVGNVERMIAEAQGDTPPISKWAAWPLPNVWLGATVVNQAEADRDIPKLLAVPARVRFLSMEPLLGPVDLTNLPLRPEYAESIGFRRNSGDRFDPLHPRRPEQHRLHWVIAGGESGPKARPMHPDWVRSLRDQCAAAGVPFHFKQWGEFFPKSNHPNLSDRDINPNLMIRIGKRSAGRLLDGVEHNAFPEARNA